MKLLISVLLSIASLVIALPSQPNHPKGFTGSDEELGALIAWIQAQRGVTAWPKGSHLAAQDVFVTELKKRGKPRLVPENQVVAAMNQVGIQPLIEPNKSQLAHIAKLIKAKYLFILALSDDREAERSGSGKFNVGGALSLIDVSTGEVAWIVSAQRPVSGVKGNTMTKQQANAALKALSAELIQKAHSKMKAR